MTLFGLSYLLVHDGLVHERLPMQFLLRWRYFRRLRGAHLHHHRFHGVPYGLFLGPEELSAAKATRRADPGVTEAA
jgi:beta-carotene 3-hydroxylase